MCCEQLKSRMSDLFVDPRVAISELFDQITQSFTRQKVDLPGGLLRHTGTTNIPMSSNGMELYQGGS